MPSSSARVVLPALLSLVATVAMAQPGGPTTLDRVEIIASRAHQTAAQAVLQQPGFERIYAMDNGARLHVVRSGSVLRMRYGLRPVVRLAADPSGHFRSQDGALVLRFRLDDDAQPSIAQFSAPASWF